MGFIHALFDLQRAKRKPKLYTNMTFSLPTSGKLHTKTEMRSHVEIQFFFQRSTKENLWISSSRVMDRSHLEIFCVPGWQPVIAIGLTLTVAVIKVQVWISTSVWNVYKWQSPNLSWKKAEAEGNWMPAQALSLHCWALWGRLDCLPQAVSSRWQKRVHWPTCKKHWKLELT